MTRTQGSKATNRRGAKPVAPKSAGQSPAKRTSAVSTGRKGRQGSQAVPKATMRNESLSPGRKVGVTRGSKRGQMKEQQNDVNKEPKKASSNPKTAKTVVAEPSHPESDLKQAVSPRRNQSNKRPTSRTASVKPHESKKRAVEEAVDDANRKPAKIVAKSKLKVVKLVKVPNQEVKDTGIGISETELKKLTDFMPQRASRSRGTAPVFGAEDLPTRLGTGTHSPKKGGGTGGVKSSASTKVPKASTASGARRSVSAPNPKVGKAAKAQKSNKDEPAKQSELVSSRAKKSAKSAKAVSASSNSSDSPRVVRGRHRSPAKKPRAEKPAKLEPAIDRAKHDVSARKRRAATGSVDSVKNDPDWSASQTKATRATKQEKLRGPRSKQSKTIEQSLDKGKEMNDTAPMKDKSSNVKSKGGKTVSGKSTTKLRGDALIAHQALDTVLTTKRTRSNSATDRQATSAKGPKLASKQKLTGIRTNAETKGTKASAKTKSIPVKVVSPIKEEKTPPPPKQAAGTPVSPGKSPAALTGQKDQSLIGSDSKKKKMSAVMRRPPPDVLQLRQPILNLRAAKSSGRSTEGVGAAAKKAEKPSASEDKLLDKKLRKPATRAIKVTTKSSRTVQKPKRKHLISNIGSPETELISKIAASIFNISPSTSVKSKARKSESNLEELIKSQVQQRGFSLSGRAIKSGDFNTEPDTVLDESFHEKFQPEAPDASEIGAASSPKKRRLSGQSHQQRPSMTSSGRVVKPVVKEPSPEKKETEAKKGTGTSPAKRTASKDKKAGPRSPGKEQTSKESDVSTYRPVSDRVKAMQAKAQLLVSKAKQRTAKQQKKTPKKTVAKPTPETPKESTGRGRPRKTSISATKSAPASAKKITPKQTAKGKSTKKATKDTRKSKEKKETSKPLTLEEAAEVVRMLAQNRRVKTVPPQVRQRSLPSKLERGVGGPLSPRSVGTGAQDALRFDLDHALPSPSSSSTETDTEALMSMTGPGGHFMSSDMIPLEVNTVEETVHTHPATSRMISTPPYRISSRRRTDTENLETVALEWNTQDLQLYSSLSALSQQQHSADPLPMIHLPPQQLSSTTTQSQSSGTGKRRSQRQRRTSARNTRLAARSPPAVRMPETLLNDHCYIKQPLVQNVDDTAESSLAGGHVDELEERRSVVDVSESFRNISMSLGANGLSSSDGEGQSGAGFPRDLVAPGTHDLLVDPYGQAGGSIVVPASLSALVTAADSVGLSLASSSVPQIVTVPTSGTVSQGSGGSPFLFHVPSSTGVSSGYGTILSSFIDPHQAVSSPPVSVSLSDYGMSTGSGHLGGTAITVPQSNVNLSSYLGFVSNPSDSSANSQNVVVSTAAQFLDMLSGVQSTSDAGAVSTSGNVYNVGPPHHGPVFQNQSGQPVPLADIVGAILQQPPVPTSASQAQQNQVPTFDPMTLGSFPSGAPSFPNSGNLPAGNHRKSTVATTSYGIGMHVPGNSETPTNFGTGSSAAGAVSTVADTSQGFPTVVPSSKFSAPPQYFDPAAVVGRSRPDLVPDFLPEDILEGDNTDSS